MHTPEFLREIKKIKLEPHGTIPELLAFKNGKPVDSPRAWERRRKEVEPLVVNTLFGGMPPAVKPGDVTVEKISGCTCDLFTRHDRILRQHWRLSIAGGAAPLFLNLTVWIPSGGGPHPVLVNGDGCWDYVTRDVVSMAIRRGWMFVHFDRCELARDSWDAPKSDIYRAFPGNYGGIAAWAWGYHRVVDALLQRPDLADAKRIAITGHSRGGKTVLLAGATDKRIAVVGDNSSGCCGSGSFHLLAKGPEGWGHHQSSERIGDITKSFGYWFAKDLPSWTNREAEFPIDGHFFESLIAPRGLFIRHALEDRWANPHGAYEMYTRAKKVWKLLGAPNNIAFSGRARTHFHELSDWEVFLDFAERVVGHAHA